MLVGTLSAQALRQTYLRGIDLGIAWTGPGADAALDRLLLAELARAEELMNIHWMRWRVSAPPDPGMVAGTDYDVTHTPVPYALPLPTEDFYRVTLWQHDVQAITRVRLYMGMSTDPVPVPIYLPVDLATVMYAYPEEALHIPTTLFPPDTTGLAWAVDYTVGVGELPFSVVQWCMLGVAIQVLSVGSAGRDVSHGLEGERLIMDGVDEQLRYGSGNSRGMPGGIYAGTVASFQYQRDEIDLVKLRFRYQGSHAIPPGFPAPPVVPTRP